MSERILGERTGFCYDMRMRRYVFTIGLLTLILSGFAGDSFATALVKTNLADMTARSGVILVGTCQKKASTSVPGIFGRARSVTTWTFSVKESLKGAAKSGADFQFKQVGLPYDIGKEYLLFLVPLPAGLWVPSGMMQGAFTITTAADGSRVVSNSLGNQFLFQGMSPDTAAPQSTLSKSVKAHGDGASGPVSLEQMREMVQQLQTKGTPIP